MLNSNSNLRKRNVVVSSNSSDSSSKTSKQQHVDNKKSFKPKKQVSFYKSVAFKLYVLAGLFALYIVSTSYASYLKQAHESHYWFKNIEVRKAHKFF